MKAVAWRLMHVAVKAVACEGEPPATCDDGDFYFFGVCLMLLDC